MTLREYAIDHLIRCGLPHDQAREVALQMESTNLSFNGRWDEDVASCPAGVVELLRMVVERKSTRLLAHVETQIKIGSVVFFDWRRT